MSALFKGIGNIANLLNQAKNIGGQMEGVTEELKTKQVTGEAGGSMVKVHANGLGQVVKVEVDPILMDKKDLEMVIDLLPAAINDANAKAKALHVQAMQEVTGGLELPAGLGDTLKNMMGSTDDTSQP
ncbi:MAG: YbaB/EbfC family nucleoid-associated protein [Planctomycetota bacterium]